MDALRGSTKIEVTGKFEQSDQPLFLGGGGCFPLEHLKTSKPWSAISSEKWKEHVFH